MPIARIDLQPGLGAETKKRLVREVTASLEEAYRIPDTRVFLREWSPGSVGIDGELDARFRPICDFVVPPGLPTEAKRRLVERVSRAVAEACDLRADVVPLPSGKSVTTRWVLTFFSEYPLERAALDGLMAFENPMVQGGMEAALQAAGGAR